MTDSLTENLLALRIIKRPIGLPPGGENFRIGLYFIATSMIGFGNGDVSAGNGFPDCITVTAAGGHPDDLAVMNNRLAAAKHHGLFNIKRKGAQFPLRSLFFDFGQCITAEKVSFVQCDAKP